LVTTDWQIIDVADFAQRVSNLAGPGRPAIVAINGNSSSGKTSLSGLLARALPDCSVVHTDDLAWHHGVFAWDQLLINDVLPVLRRGEPLQYRPPAWIARGREGAITLDGSRQFVLIEGVGASQASIRSQLDVIIWVHTPQSVRETRDAARVAAGEISAASYANWMAEENAYLAAERPWQHADLIVDGSRNHDHQAVRVTTVVQSSSRASRAGPGGSGSSSVPAASARRRTSSRA
jgi:uridine kinase